VQNVFMYPHKIMPILISRNYLFHKAYLKEKIYIFTVGSFSHKNLFLVVCRSIFQNFSKKVTIPDKKFVTQIGTPFNCPNIHIRQ